ncbi:MAG: hypothetical protein PHE27_03370 [Alphaproteobacteria bacterium]|nr:hypothetical protein [Alphaproteobacteria bacterium]
MTEKTAKQDGLNQAKKIITTIAGPGPAYADRAKERLIASGSFPELTDGPSWATQLKNEPIVKALGVGAIMIGMSVVKNEGHHGVQIMAASGAAAVAAPWAVVNAVGLGEGLVYDTLRVAFEKERKIAEKPIRQTTKKKLETKLKHAVGTLLLG